MRTFMTYAPPTLVILTVAGLIILTMCNTQQPSEKPKPPPPATLTTTWRYKKAELTLKLNKDDGETFEEFMDTHAQYLEELRAANVLPTEKLK